MDHADNDTTESDKPITRALRHLLRPLVRLLLSQGISFQVFSEMVKAAYVRVSEEEFKLDAKPQTDSRISLLTGIHRREVSRLRNQSDVRSELSQHASMSALLLTIWSGHPEYLDEQSKPRPLPRLASQSGGPSFESMVRSISKDFRARVVLDEWLRQGIVTLDQHDQVHLTTEAFVQPKGIDEKIFYFGKNIHDHLAATVHNLNGPPPLFMERCVYYDKLTQASIDELASYSREIGMKALHAVNKRAAFLQQRDMGKPDAINRNNFGIYHFSETDNGHDAPEK